MPAFARVAFSHRGCVVALASPATALERGDKCVVEMENGQQDVGTYTDANTQGDPAAGLDGKNQPRLLRKATEADLARVTENAKLAELALLRFTQRLREAGIVVKPLAAVYTLGRDRLLLIFSAREHIDCRRVVGQLQRELKTRIEVWHTAARDEMAVVGGFGACGRVFCCASWMRQIKSVSLRMVRDQGLELNPMSVNGCCGKLKCCLRFEHEAPCRAAAQKSSAPAAGTEREVS
ncbi:MAG: regulatory iron-sulfur-containing complex subunit RicT [Kiritimatiellia bacterium]